MRTIWVLAVVFVGGSIGMSSCAEEETVETSLLSFGPAGVLHGEDIIFVGTGLDKVESIVFPVDVEVLKSEFKSHTSNKIVVTVPVETTEGKVILKTADGEIESKTSFGLTYEIQVTGVPDNAKPGTEATFTGEFLNYVKEVTFYDGLSVSDFVSQSRTELVVIVPLSAKTGPVQFSNGDLEPLIAETVLNITLPEVTDITPLSVKHAESLTLIGNDLDLVTSIEFPGGAVVPSANFVSQEESEIVVTVPVTAVNGKLTLSVASEQEVETASSITIILPSVTSFSPALPEDHTAGTTLTITGTDLDLVGSIKFPGVSTSVTSFTKTATQIDVVIPNGVQGGTLILITVQGFNVPVTVPFGNQLTLLAVIFDDAVRSPFGKGGWGSPDVANTENPRVGSVSIKSTFTGGYSGGGQFGTWGNSPLSTAGTTYVAFSVFGGAGTEGKTLIVNFNGGPQAYITLTEGSWKDVKVALTDIGSPASISEISFQDGNWSGVVYIDQIGLK